MLQAITDKELIYELHHADMLYWYRSKTGTWEHVPSTKGRLGGATIVELIDYAVALCGGNIKYAADIEE